MDIQLMKKVTELAKNEEHLRLYIHERLMDEEEGGAKKLAQSIGISYMTFYRFLHGSRNPHLAQRLMMAKYLIAKSKKKH